MRLRPATPLTLFFVVAFVLLLLSTLSTPIIKSIPLGSYNDTEYGVFGSCNTTGCRPLRIGYDLTDFSSTNLGMRSRHTLSSILIIHPIAAFMTLLCAVLAAASHFRGPSHSPRYLLFLLILTFPTLLVSLLAFLVDILLFIPHMRWGGWIVLVATIIITVCSVLTCAMRRTLVSRKARKKRIAENADMNGENFYAMQANQQAAHQANQQAIQPPQQYPRAESPPPMDGPNHANDVNKLPQFATFQVGRRAPDTDSRTPITAREPIEPGQTPLGPVNTSGSGNRLQMRDDMPRPAVLTTATVGATAAGSATQSSRFARDQTRSDTVSSVNDVPIASGFQRQPTQTRIPQGPPGNSFDGAPSQTGQMLMANGDLRAPPPSYGRGRGGYPPPRGQYPPRGFPSRGSYGRDGRVNMPSPNMPPPSWNDAPRGMAPRVRGQVSPPGYPARPPPGRGPSGGSAQYPGGAPIPMPYAPASPPGGTKSWTQPTSRFPGDNPRSAEGEPFAINTQPVGGYLPGAARYHSPENGPPHASTPQHSGRVSMERARWQDNPNQPSDNPQTQYSGRSSMERARWHGPDRGPSDGQQPQYSGRSSMERARRQGPDRGPPDGQQPQYSGRSSMERARWQSLERGPSSGPQPQYSGRSPTERAPWQSPQGQSLNDARSPAEYGRQPVPEQSVTQRPYGYTVPAEESYRRDHPTGNATISDTGDRSPAIAQPSSGHEVRNPDVTIRNPASFGFSGIQPYAGRTQPVPIVSSPAAAQPSPAQYAGLPGQALELDTNDNRSDPVELEPQEQYPTAELDSRELGGQAPLGGQSQGMFPSRSTWRQGPVELGDSSPVRTSKPSPYTSPIESHSATELPGLPSPSNTYASPNLTTIPQPATHIPDASEAYIEDVDPRFASDDHISTHGHVPDLPTFQLPPIVSLSSEPLIPLSMDPLNRGDNRSPAQSETSNFTSISQRQINPNWHPGLGGAGPRLRGDGGGGGGPMQQRFQPDVLASNPDFSLRAAPALARRPVGGGGGGGGATGPGTGVGAETSHVRGPSYGSHQYYDGA